MKKEIEILPIYFDWLIEKNYPVNILVGGRNSGKSYFMQQLAVIKTNNSADYTLLVIEDIETNIGAGVKSGIEKRAAEFGLDGLFSSTKVPPEIRHANGNKVLFKGYRYNSHYLAMLQWYGADSPEEDDVVLMDMHIVPKFEI